MAEENQELNQEVQPEVKEASLSPVEQKASEQGWVPKEEWDESKGPWRSAQEFLDRGELFKKIDDQNRTLKQFKQVIDDLKKHNQRIAKVEYQRALDQLKAQKKEALTEGDADAVIEIDEKMAHVREAVKQAEAQPAPETQSGELNPIFVAWKEQNQWYDNNRAMRAFADSIGIELGSRGGMSHADILAEVKRQVQAEFPDKFTNPRRASAPAVEGSTNKGASKKEDFHLTDDERRVMERFVRSGALTKEEYIKQLKEAKQRGV